MASNVDTIYEALKQEIIDLTLIPGTKIKEEDLASRFATSRTPIRSVIARLEKEGLVVVVPQKGTYVSKINLSNISDYIYIRKAIEMTVMDELEDTLSKDQFDTLDDIIAKQHEIMKMEPSIEKAKLFFYNDNLFHHTLFTFAGKEGVWEIYNREATILNRARILANMRDVNQVQFVYDQHCEVVKALKDHNLKEAKRLFALHMDGGFEGIQSIVEKYNDYFI